MGASSEESCFPLFHEILHHFDNSRIDVREAAVNLLLQFSQNKDFVTFACLYPHEVLKRLVNTIGSEQTLSSKSVEILINLTETGIVAEALVKLDAIDILMENLKDQSKFEAAQHEALNLMLLSNLSRVEFGKQKLLQIDGVSSKTMGMHLLTLLFSFFDQSPSNRTHDDTYLWIAHILVNVTTVEAGRDFLIKSDCTSCELVPMILGLIYCISEIHIKGNDPSKYEGSDWPFNKLSKSSKIDISQCIEGLSLTKIGRDGLRNLGLYEVLRVWLLLEMEEEIKEEIGRLAHILQYPEEIAVDKMVSLNVNESLDSAINGEN
ncbi:hypothetical protein IE077_002742 [Cardiosporidium cionae]|uniref:Protein HGH1 homolog n=1 Tax=Cardiosporidium cionae TaxID=476202 RepID=A0ABQ7J4H2_9APIC|nr:hypothetical protein IE077_002742 [Cardiosporidium cionae]|eukprot:KAF8817931.1 hypothetical protein IE077_002742 [Cardiosporidium cionae]